MTEKQRESVYKEFKEAADHFFNNKRSKNSEVEKEFEENLSKKEEVCNKIEQLAKDSPDDLEKLRDLQDDLAGCPPRAPACDAGARSR